MICPLHGAAVTLRFMTPSCGSPMLALPFWRCRELGPQVRAAPCAVSMAGNFSLLLLLMAWSILDQFTMLMPHM